MLSIYQYIMGVVPLKPCSHNKKAADDFYTLKCNGKYQVVPSMSFAKGTVIRTSTGLCFPSTDTPEEKYKTKTTFPAGGCICWSQETTNHRRRSGIVLKEITSHLPKKVRKHYSIKCINEYYSSRNGTRVGKRKTRKAAISITRCRASQAPKM